MLGKRKSLHETAQNKVLQYFFDKPGPDFWTETFLLSFQKYFSALRTTTQLPFSSIIYCIREGRHLHSGRLQNWTIQINKWHSRLEGILVFVILKLPPSDCKATIFVIFLGECGNYIIPTSTIIPNYLNTMFYLENLFFFLSNRLLLINHYVAWRYRCKPLLNF